MKKYKVGYTQGVYDMFHIGHLNLLNHAKEYCDYLIVGINSDKLVEEYKKKHTVINEQERALIVSNIKAVDEVIIVDSLDKKTILKQKPFDAIFIGDDWKGSERWNATEKELAEFGVDVVYLKHTDGISSTILRVIEENAIKD
jgi:glycerol-3-phosphate cytidylyltransferase